MVGCVPNCDGSSNCARGVGCRTRIGWFNANSMVGLLGQSQDDNSQHGRGRGSRGGAGGGRANRQFD
eukprot:6310184-Prymnesium_polylepis.1